MTENEHLRALPHLKVQFKPGKLLKEAMSKPLVAVDQGVSDREIVTEKPPNSVLHLQEEIEHKGMTAAAGSISIAQGDPSFGTHKGDI